MRRRARGIASWLAPTVALALLACEPPTGSSSYPPALETAAPERARRVADEAARPAVERARAHRSLVGGLIRRGQLEEAAARLETAAELFAGEPAELPLTLNSLSDVYFRLGDFAGQEAVLWRALEVAVDQADSAQAAVSWNNLGVSFAARGRPSAALAAYRRCLELHQGLDDRADVSGARHNLGVQMLMLGRVGEGIGELERAVAERRSLKDPAAVGQTLASLAWGLALDGRVEEASAAYDEALALLAAAQWTLDLAVALEQRSQLHRRLGRLPEARADLARSGDLLAAGDGASPLQAAYVDLGLAATRRRRDARAEELLRGALEAFDAVGAQEGRIMARLELARLLRRDRAGLAEAERQLGIALELIEAARSDLRLPAFRATFLSGWQGVYQELVDLLASASLSAAEGGRPAEARALAERALEAAERARARSLLDRVATAAAEPLVAAPAAGSESRALRREVEALEAETLLATSQAAARPGARGSGRPKEARAALRQARLVLEQAEEVSRQAVPPPPSARPAGVAAIRAELAPGDVLLIYSLAPGRGWLWRLDREGLDVSALPRGPELDAAARNAHQLLPVHHRPAYGRAARLALARLAEQVLGPLRGRLGDGRLIIVPDGALHLVPFGALPVPGEDGAASALLIETHEIVHLPSASTLVELRRREHRQSAARPVAVVVDPVFEADDPRLTGVGPRVADGELPNPALAPTRRALNGRLGRLPASAEEAERIAEIVRESVGVAPPVYSGFEASRELVTGGGLGGFRIVHFATHGVVDAEDPALAGLVLSLYDEGGKRRDGLLRARDLHDLRLPADLVVLSACRTALGQEVRGEGIVGLADGFFAAGVSSLVVSLWDVDDRATAELMVRFYRHLLVGGRGPGEALRHAQLELREETEWRAPEFWAGFVAVGDWRPWLRCLGAC